MRNGLNVLSDGLEKFWNLLIYTRAYIAIGSVFVIYSLSSFRGFEFTPSLGLAVFGAVFAVYAMNRKSDLDEDESNLDFGGPELAHRTYQIGLISLIGSIAIALLVNPYVLGITLTFIALISAYSFKILPSSFRYRRLKDIPFVKNIVVGVSLAILWVSGSFMQGMPELNSLLLGVFLFLSLRVLIGAVIPDIRDIEGDKKAGIETVPVLYGVKRTKELLVAVNLFTTVLYFWMVHQSIMPFWALLAGSVNFLAFPLILKTNENNADKMTLITEFNTLFTFSILLIAGGLL